jgi:hypothetical protein
MPHFGLMDETKLGPVAGPFQRSRLHLRAGKRRLRQGKISAGIVTLYDALTAAMESYAAASERTASLSIKPGEDLRNDKILYAVLVRSGVLDGHFDFEMFEQLMERALSDDLSVFDYGPLLAGLECVLTQLRIIPFDESSLPPEKPDAF